MMILKQKLGTILLPICALGFVACSADSQRLESMDLCSAEAHSVEGKGVGLLLAFSDEPPVQRSLLPFRRSRLKVTVLLKNNASSSISVETPVLHSNLNPRIFFEDQEVQPSMITFAEPSIDEAFFVSLSPEECLLVEVDVLRSGAYRLEKGNLYSLEVQYSPYHSQYYERAEPLFGSELRSGRLEFRY